MNTLRLKEIYYNVEYYKVEYFILVQWILLCGPLDCSNNLLYPNEYITVIFINN